jgi:hypothetical protein
MNKALLLLAITLFMTGCERKAERFEDLQKLSGAQFFIREIPNDLKEGDPISFGYIENSNKTEYIGDIFPEKGSSHIDLYFFSNPLRLGWVSGKKSGVIPFTIDNTDQFGTTFIGKEKGIFSEPILRLSNANNPSNSSATNKREVEFILYTTTDG